MIHEARGRFEDGERDARESLEIRRKYLAEGKPQTASARSVLGGCLLGQGRFAEAEPLLLDGFNGLLATRGIGEEHTRNALDRLANLYLQTNRPEAARQHVVPTLVEALERDAAASTLAGAASQVAKLPGFDDDTYRLALQAAERAVTLAPDEPIMPYTLGVTEFRLGRFEEALGTLMRADRLFGGTNYAVQAFLAMTYQRLDQPAQAREALRVSRALIQARGKADSIAGRALLSEAARLIESQTGPD